MESTQQFSLRWNNYLRHLTYSLDNLRLNDEFVDVSLCVDGRKIRAHKVVLSACSTFFKDIFKENPQPHHVIVFKLVSFQDLNAIIEFMYQGQVNVRQDALKSFLQTAALLSVQGLTSEDNVKPHLLLPPIINEEKLIKTIPSTVRPVNEAATTLTQTQTSTQTIDIPATSIMEQVAAQNFAIQSQHLQNLQQQQHHRQNVQTAQISHLHVQQATQTCQQQHQEQQVTQLPTQGQLTGITQPHQQQSRIAQHVTLTNAFPLHIGSSASKKRKITFTADEEDNLYTTETIGYTSKDDHNIVKIYSKDGEMTFLRDSTKLDMPDYIVTDIDDRLSDGVVSPTSQDDAAADAEQAVHQYSSEFEILTESELEEKAYHTTQTSGEVMEIGDLLTTNTQLPAARSNNQEISLLENSTGINQTNSNLLETGRILDNKCSNTSLTDPPHNKWTECQFCKMVITTVNLWRHIRTQHTPQPPRKCEHCQKNFKNKYSLREHIRISHEQKVAIKVEN